MKTSSDSAAVPVAEVAGMGSDGSPPLVPPGASAIGTDTRAVRIFHRTYPVGIEYDVRIDRTTRWGNPFHIGRDGTRAEVIAKYEAWIQTQPNLLAALPELRGKRLGCWCKPKACHGDVLARLADGAVR